MYVLWSGAGPGLRLRLAATNLLAREGVSGSRYACGGADGTRESLFRTSTGAALRLTLEYSPGK